MERVCKEKVSVASSDNRKKKLKTVGIEWIGSEKVSKSGTHSQNIPLLWTTPAAFGVFLRISFKSMFDVSERGDVQL